MSTSTELVPIFPPSLIPRVPFEGLFWERLPVVTDASTLINDCLRLVRREREPLLLHLARSPGCVNLYATTSIREEVEEHLPRAARGSHLLPRAAERAWRDQCRPMVSFVDIEARPWRDPRIAQLATLDPDDAPTGTLAELLGPCLVFSNDSHLLDSGIARNDWGDLLTQAREVGLFQAGTSITVVGTLALGFVGVELGRAIIEGVRRWPLPAVAVAAAGGYFLFSHWQSERGVSQRREARGIAADIGKELSAFLDRATEAEQLLERAAFVSAGEPTPLAGVARVIATAPRPLRPGEIASRVSLSPQRVTALLRDPIFCRTADGQYVLGRRG